MREFCSSRAIRWHLKWWEAYVPLRHMGNAWSFRKTGKKAKFCISRKNDLISHKIRIICRKNERRNAMARLLTRRRNQPRGYLRLGNNRPRIIVNINTKHKEQEKNFLNLCLSAGPSTVYNNWVSPKGRNFASILAHTHRFCFIAFFSIFTVHTSNTQLLVEDKTHTREHLRKITVINCGRVPVRFCFSSLFFPDYLRIYISSAAIFFFFFSLFIVAFCSLDAPDRRLRSFCTTLC